MNIVETIYLSTVLFYCVLLQNLCAVTKVQWGKKKQRIKIELYSNTYLKYVAEQREEKSYYCSSDSTLGSPCLELMYCSFSVWWEGWWCHQPHGQHHTTEVSSTQQDNSPKANLHSSPLQLLLWYFLALSVQLQELDRFHLIYSYKTTRHVMAAFGPNTSGIFFCDSNDQKRNDIRKDE